MRLFRPAALLSLSGRAVTVPDPLLQCARSPHGLLWLLGILAVRLCTARDRNGSNPGE